MTKRLLNNYGGVLTWFEKNPVTGEVTISYSQDCAPIVKDNIISQNSGHDGYSKSRELRRVANIPNSLLLKWKLEEGIDFYNPNHKEAIRRKLNDPDYRFLRTSLGTI